MKSGDILNKKLQNTMEYIIILSIVIVGAILFAVLYTHSSSNIKIGNTDTLLAVAYFSGVNGQPICNATEGESQCFEILLTQPLPKYPTYNLTYWNEKDPSGNYTFESEQDNYLICVTSPVSNQFNGYPTICDGLDNYNDVNYIGQVDGYYEYTINEYGFPIGQIAFLSYLTLYYHSPNLFGNLTNTTYILTADGKPLPVEMYLNATSLVPISPEQSTQISSSSLDSVLSVTEIGLPAGSSLSYNEAFSNGTVASNSFVIPSNSENSFIINNLTEQFPQNVQLTLTGKSNGVILGKTTLNTSDNGNLFVNFTQPAPIELIAPTNTIGPFVVTLNKNQYSSILMQFPNMVVTTENGAQDDAYITNMTNNQVEFFIENPANVIYLNFERTSQLNPNGPTGESPNMNLSAYGKYDDGPLVFNEYTNFAGPSSGTFGTENTLEQNTIISNVITSGPFTFDANGNQIYGYNINNEFTLTAKGSNYEYENLYLPITTGETYIIGGQFASGENTNIGIVNSTNNNDSNAVWLNGLFARASWCAIWFYGKGIGGGLQSGGPDEPSYSNYYYSGYPPSVCINPDTFSTYSLNGNSVTIAFPMASYSATLSGSPKYFVIESSDAYGPFYYLAETTNPVHLEICNTYSTPNTITCST